LSGRSRLLGPCPPDGLFCSAVRRRRPLGYQVTHRPDIPPACVVRPVRAHAPGKGGVMSTPPGPADGRPDPGLDAIMSERRQLISLAYRLLGALDAGADAVQETYVRAYAP